MKIPGILVLCVPFVISNPDISNKTIFGRLEGAQYSSISPLGELQCVKKCLGSTKCLSINYQRETLYCQLNSMKDKNSLTNDNSWKYVEKSDVADVFPLDACSQKICPANHMCVELSNTDLKCILTECEDPADAANAAISSFKVAVSEQTFYTCNTFYFMTGNNDVTCQTDGTFTAVNFVCELIPCGVPSSVSYATLSNYQTSVGSSATYTCNYGYTMSGSGNLQCELGGTWSAVTFSCDEIQCSSPPSVSHAHVTSYNTYVGGYAHYDCDTLYSTSEAKHVQCQLGGYWSSVAFTCKFIGVFG